MEGKSVRKNQQGMECEENIMAVTWSELDIFYFVSLVCMTLLVPYSAPFQQTFMICIECNVHQVLCSSCRSMRRSICV